MQHVRWIDAAPKLRQPMLVLAFEGWNDAGDAATTTASHLIERFDGEPFANIDAELFYDFSSTRPLVRLNEHAQRRIEWPVSEFSLTVIPDASRDVVVFSGTEPQLRWKTFSEQIVAVAQELGIELVVTLGALVADVVHSRPTTVYGTSHDPALCEALDLEPTSYEGPTGIVGVVHQACADAGLASMSLWATVPSYVPHAPSPKAALALIERLGDILKVPMTTNELIEEASAYEEQINVLVADDDDTRAYVAQLEEQYDASRSPESTAGLIEDLEAFLRDQ